jgi:hypothetical protein
MSQALILLHTGGFLTLHPEPASLLSLTTVPSRT